MISTMKFTLPEDTVQVQTLGYAWGLNDGIFSGTLPIEAKGPVLTNDHDGFFKTFNAWYDLGLTFGSRAKRKLVRVLDTMPQQWWWSICLAFASEHVKAEGADELVDSSPYIQQGLQAFQKIYHEDLL